MARRGWMPLLGTVTHRRHRHSSNSMHPYLAASPIFGSVTHIWHCHPYLAPSPLFGAPHRTP
eukprot:242381-Prymnesium_polylepis.1